MKTMKGQIAFTNLLALFVSFLLYCFLLPMLDQVSADAVAVAVASGNPNTAIIVAEIYIFPVILLAGLCLTVFNLAIPKPAQYQ